MDGVAAGWSNLREADGGAARSDRMRAAQIAALYRIAPAGIVGALLTGPILAGVLIRLGGASTPLLAAWLACLFAAAIIHLLHCRAYRRNPPKETKWRPWAFGFSLISAAEGLIWGLGGVILMAPQSLDQQLFIMLVVAVLAVGSIAAFGTYLPATLLFVFFSVAPITPFMLWRAQEADDVRYSIA